MGEGGWDCGRLQHRNACGREGASRLLVKHNKRPRLDAAQLVAGNLPRARRCPRGSHFKRVHVRPVDTHRQKRFPCARVRGRLQGSWHTSQPR